MKLDHRIVVLKALVGSHNYNLNTESSDKDYKYFVLPTLDDLYNGTIFSASKVSNTVDYSAHDVRKLDHLLWKANVNFLAVLYSQELTFLGEAGKLKDFLLENRAELCKMNLPYLYNACLGFATGQWSSIKKDTPMNHGSIEKYGYSIKAAYQSIRMLVFIDRMVQYNFDFQKAIWYEDEIQGLLIAVKLGLRSFDTVEQWYDELLETVKEHKPIFENCGYQAEGPNVELRERLRATVKDLIFDNVRAGVIR